MEKDFLSVQKQTGNPFNFVPIYFKNVRYYFNFMLTLYNGTMYQVYVG